MKVQVITSQAPAPSGTYSQGIVINGFLYTAGLGPQDPSTGMIVDGGIAEQTRQVMQNLEAILTANGLSNDNLVKTTVHLSNLREDFAEFNDVYGEFVRQPYPVRTTVGSTLAGILVEVDAIAAM